MSLWLIGAGGMAKEYARVLRKLGASFLVVGRGEKSAADFQSATKQRVLTGGLTNALFQYKAPQKAIIAVSVEQLALTTTTLIRAGVKRILVEKPAGLNSSEIMALSLLARENGATVLVAYNRRYYDSVLQLRQFIIDDGGVLSAQFEFSELSHIIKPLEKAAGVKERWLLANSTHVIVLAFLLIGLPIDWKSWYAGKIDWHPASARFVGAGVTDKNVMFSYLADWQAPGRWGIELLTAKNRLTLRPFEKLQVTPLGSVTAEELSSVDSLDQEYKPGVFRQTEAFIAGDDHFACTIDEQARNVKIYSEMAGYK